MPGSFYTGANHSGTQEKLLVTLYALDGVRPKLPSDICFIAPTATVIGNVIVSEEASIWFGVVIRGDNEPITIGERSNVQDNTMIHTDPGFPVIIGKGCTIGHNAIIHGCQIGDNSLVGMGAKILNGAKIGKNCLIGAGALITEGKVIPDNSLVVGSPGKVIRQLDEAAVKGLANSADIYVANAKRYLKGLEVIPQGN